MRTAILFVLLSVSGFAQSDANSPVREKETKPLNSIQYANLWASNGSGTCASPWRSPSGTGGILEAYNSLPSAGGKIEMPVGVYALTMPFTPHAGKPAILQGQGANSTIVAFFGDAQYSCNAASQNSTVLLVTGANDAIDLPTRMQGLVLRDFLVLGPGTGTSKGISFAGTGGMSYNQADNVLVMNFGTCWNFSNAVSNWFGYIAARGCANGFSFNNTVADLDFGRIELQRNTTGWNQTAGTGVRVHSGLVQANKNGLLVAPESGSATNSIYWSSIWFEQNANYAVKFDSTNAPINDIQILYSRCAASGDTIQFVGSKTFGRFTLASNNFNCGSFTGFPLTATGWAVSNTLFPENRALGSSHVVEVGGEINGIRTNDTLTFASMVSDLSHNLSLNSSQGNFLQLGGNGKNDEFVIDGGGGQFYPSHDINDSLGNSTHHWKQLFVGSCYSGGPLGTTSPAACGSNAAGVIAVPASQTSYTVNTTVITRKTQIFIEQVSDNSGLPSSPTCSGTPASPMLSARVVGAGFTFTLTPVAGVTCFEYWVIN